MDFDFPVMLSTSLVPRPQEDDRPVDMAFREKWMCVAILSLSDGDMCEEGGGGEGGGATTEGGASSEDDGGADS